jgi:hypothetical protein
MVMVAVRVDLPEPLRYPLHERAGVIVTREEVDEGEPMLEEGGLVRGDLGKIGPRFH